MSDCMERLDTPPVKLQAKVCYLNEGKNIPHTWHFTMF